VKYFLLAILISLCCVISAQSLSTEQSLIDLQEMLDYFETPFQVDYVSGSLVFTTTAAFANEYEVSYNLQTALDAFTFYLRIKKIPISTLPPNFRVVFTSPTGRELLTVRTIDLQAFTRSSNSLQALRNFIRP